MCSGMPYSRNRSASAQSTSCEVRALDADRQTLVGELIDHGEQLQGTAVVGAFRHEVISPDVVTTLRPQTDTGAVGKPQTASLGLAAGHLEALRAPDALHALLVDVLAGHLQQAGDALVAVAPEAPGQGDDGRGQGVLV